MRVRVDGLHRGQSWDHWGVSAATLCAAHCIATPFAAMALPAMAAAEGVTHGALAVAVLLFALLAFMPALKRHGKRRVLILGAIGLGLIWTAVLLPQDAVDDGWRDLLTVAGGLVMVAAHVINRALCRRCAVGCDECSAGKSSGVESF